MDVAMRNTTYFNIQNEIKLNKNQNSSNGKNSLYGTIYVCIFIIPLHYSDNSSTVDRVLIAWFNHSEVGTPS